MNIENTTEVIWIADDVQVSNNGDADFLADPRPNDYIFPEIGFENVRGLL